MRKNSPICVSVITPSYNQGKYLAQTIQSVQNQTYKNVEYIVIDGGSTDNSINIIKEYEKQIAYWISEPDNGQADAINKGFKYAQGEFICWINSDDILYPHYIESRVRQFEEYSDVNMIYGDIDQGTDPTQKRCRKGKQTNITNMLKYAKCPIPQQSAMWRRKVIEEIGLLDSQWHVVLDREYFTRIAAKGPIKYIPGEVAFFRNHEKSKSIMERIKWSEELPRYYEMLFDENIYNLPSNLLSYRNRCLSKVYLTCARISAKAGREQDAEEFFMKSRQTSFYHYFITRYLKHIL